MRNYLIAQIKEERGLAKLCAENGDLQEEILDTIIAKASGMSVFKA